MSVQWKVELQYIDGRSKKFWRARTEGDELHINFGRLGSDGQSKTKTFDSAAAAVAELDKLATSKRGKGYVDTAAAPCVVAVPAVAPTAPSGPSEQTLRRDVGGRALELRLKRSGGVLETVVIERYDDQALAEAAMRRIHAALVDEGWS